MPFTRIIIHAVWGTKNRDPFLKGEIKEKIISHILENAKQKEIYIDRLNGHHDHLHCLFILPRDMSIGKVMQLIKGESSAWINKNKITPNKFAWATEYFAVSVSEKRFGKVRAYIDNQEEYHRKKTFQEEYQLFLDSYGAGNDVDLTG